MISPVRGAPRPDLSSAGRLEVLARAEIFRLITFVQRSALLL